MKRNDVPATLQAFIRIAIEDIDFDTLAGELHTTVKNIKHAHGADGRPVTWDFIGRLAYYRPDLWAQIVIVPKEPRHG